jgi:hypothetical protein
LAAVVALVEGVKKGFGEVEACVMAAAPWDRVGGARDGALRRV